MQTHAESDLEISEPIVRSHGLPSVVERLLAGSGTLINSTVPLHTHCIKADVARRNRT